MVTLDGVKYTFNGQGEFIVLKLNKTDFVLQARMLPLTNDRGQPTKATVFTAFAMKAKNSVPVQVTWFVVSRNLRRCNSPKILFNKVAPFCLASFYHVKLVPVSIR